MFEKKLNKNSVEFLQKISMFIDSVLINAVSSTPTETDRILSGGLLSIKEAIHSEITNDVFVEKFNSQLTQKKNKKKDQEDLNQEKRLVSDQSV